MGEYAERKSDGIEVKIGTCDSMYYLRYEDRNKVKPVENSLNPAGEDCLFWRLPFPDEDNIQVGEYTDYKRGYRLYKNEKDERGHEWSVNFSDPKTVGDAGIMQFHNDSGLLVNVKCFHGEKLPESTEDAQFHWNGKSWHFELAHIQNMKDKVLPVVRCRFCGNMWRYDWNDIMPFIADKELKQRLEKYNHKEATT